MLVYISDNLDDSRIVKECAWISIFILDVVLVITYPYWDWS